MEKSGCLDTNVLVMNCLYLFHIIALYCRWFLIYSILKKKIWKGEMIVQIKI